jgi:hypothetical protein
MSWRPRALSCPRCLSAINDGSRVASWLRNTVTKDIDLLYRGLPVGGDPHSVLYGDVGGIDVERVGEDLGAKGIGVR